MYKFLVSFMLISTLACGQKGAQKESSNKIDRLTNGWKTFDGPNYSIKYPSNWELDQSSQLGTSFVLYSPLENNKDQLKENVNLIIQDLTGRGIDLDEFIQISEGQVKTLITNSTLVESSRIKSDYREFHKMIYSGDQGIYRLKFVQYIWIINQKAYILTLTCEQKKFSDYKETGEMILNSFLFKY